MSVEKGISFSEWIQQQQLSPPFFFCCWKWAVNALQVAKFQKITFTDMGQDWSIITVYFHLLIGLYILYEDINRCNLCTRNNLYMQIVKWMKFLCGLWEMIETASLKNTKAVSPPYLSCSADWLPGRWTGKQRWVEPTTVACWLSHTDLLKQLAVYLKGCNYIHKQPSRRL